MKITIDDLKKLKASEFKNIENCPDKFLYKKPFNCLLYKASRRVHGSGYRCFDIYAFDGKNVYSVGGGDAIHLPFDNDIHGYRTHGHMHMDVLDSGVIRLWVSRSKIIITSNYSDFEFYLIEDKNK